MNILGNRQRLCIDGWLMAALMLLALNGYGYFALESRALEGNSHTITALQYKLKRLESAFDNIISPTSGKIFNGSFFTRSDAKQSAQPQVGHRTEDPGHAGNANQTELPLLTGILEVLDPVGGVHYLAVLNGKVCREKERVENFTVTKISKSGVMLKGFDAQWEIKSPAPYYSNDQGE